MLGFNILRFLQFATALIVSAVIAAALTKPGGGFLAGAAAITGVNGLAAFIRV
jgi:hypothetical protein